MLAMVIDIRLCNYDKDTNCLTYDTNNKQFYNIIAQDHTVVVQGTNRNITFKLEQQQEKLIFRSLEPVSSKDSIYKDCLLIVNLI